MGGILGRLFREVKKRSTTSSNADEIERLKALRDSGDLTQAQYERAVDSLLDRQRGGPGGANQAPPPRRART